MSLKTADDLRMEIEILRLDAEHPEGAVGPITHAVVHHFLDSDPSLLEASLEVIKEQLICSICESVVYNTMISSCCFNVFCYGCKTLWYLENHECPACSSVESKPTRKSNEIEAILDVIMEKNQPGYLDMRAQGLAEQRMIYFYKMNKKLQEASEALNLSSEDEATG